MERESPGTEAEYAELAADVERGGDYVAVPGSATVSPQLRMGRPAGGAKRGKSPVRNVRLPADMDSRLTSTAEAEGTTPSELIRTAIAEYLARHSA